jgi:hypothetical protein
MTTSTQRGTVVQVPSGSNPGHHFVAGQQIPFLVAAVWQSPAAPSVNQTVEITLDEAGNAVRIVVLDAQTLAKEKLGQFAGLAGDQGQQVATQGKAVLRQVSGRMGMVLMVVCAALFLAWFFLPALSINSGFGYTKSFSVSNILGIEVSQGSADSHFGFWSFLGLVAVVLPWLAPWLHARWASLFNAAPLLMLIVAFAHVRWQIHELVSQAIDQVGQLGGAQAQSMVAGMVDQMSSRISQAISFEIGFWIVLLISLALAVIGLQRYVRHPRFAPAI